MKRRTVSPVACSLLLGVFLVGMLGCGEDAKPSRKSPAAAAPAAAALADPNNQISAIVFWNMASNEAQIRKRFPGRFIVSGDVFKVEHHDYDGWHVQLFCHENVRGVDGWIDCMMEDSSGAGLDSLSQGHSVAVEGVYDKGTGAVIKMTQCRLVSPNASTSRGQHPTAEQEQHSSRTADKVAEQQPPQVAKKPSGPPVVHPFFSIRPGHDFYYTRHWTAPIPDDTIIRRHNDDGSVDVIGKFVAERYYYRVKEGVLEVAKGRTKDDDSWQEGPWQRVLLPKVEGDQSWEVTPALGERTICKCTDAGQFNTDSSPFAKYRGQKQVRILEKHVVSGAFTDYKTIVVDMRANTYVEGLGLVAHEFYRSGDEHLAYTEQLVEVKPPLGTDITSEVAIDANTAQEKANQEKAAKEKAEREDAEIAKMITDSKAAQEKAEKEKAEKERLAAEAKANQEKAAEMKAAQEKAEKEKADKERLAAQAKAAQEKADQEKAAADLKVAQEKADKEKAEQEKMVADAKAAQEKAEKDKVDAEAKAAQEKAEQEKMLADAKAAQVKAEKEKADAEMKAAKEKAEHDKMVADAKAAQEKAEREKAAADLLEKTYGGVKEVTADKENADKEKADKAAKEKAVPEMRTWTPDNEKSFRAKFVRVEKDSQGHNHVILRKADGTMKSVRQIRLSEEDHKYIRQHTKAEPSPKTGS